MADYTPNLNLEKPVGNENFRRQVINDNMDKIDKPFGVGTGEGHIHNGTAGQGPKIDYNDLNNKPTSMTPTAHKSTHASGGADVLTPADIGAETPAGAQAKVDAHANASDPHPQYALDTDLNSHTALTSAHGATSAATANTIIMRDASGRAKVAAPSASDDIARKAEVDTKVSKSGDTMTGILTVPNLKAQINISSSSNPSAWPVGFVAGIVYNNGYPVNYGTIFSYKGTSGNSCVQILQAWPGTNGGEAYLYIRSSRDSGADVFGPWRKVWSENNDGAGSGLDADMVDGKHASDFQSNTKVYGNVTYTDSIAANSTLTKTIALGGTYKHGIAIIKSNSSDTNSIMTFFCVDNLKTKVVGYYNGSTPRFATWCRESLGQITKNTRTNDYGLGVSASGNPLIDILECYISGTNLPIQFNNFSTSAASLNCTIYWEVW